MLERIANISFDTRKLLIGAFIGIFSFTFLAWIDKDSWNSLEKQVLESRSFFNINTRKDKTFILSFDKSAESKFEGESEESQREYLINLIKTLRGYDVLSISFALSNLSKERIDDLDLILNLNDYGMPISFLQNEKIETEKITTQKQIKLLNQGSLGIKSHSIEELFSGEIPSTSLIDKNVLIKTQTINNSELKKMIKLWLNDNNSNWISYLAFSNLLLLLLMIIFGGFFASVTYSTRIIVFFSSTFVYFFIGQIIFSIFNFHLETMPFLSALTFTFLLANLFDINYKSLKPDLKPIITVPEEKPEIKTIINSDEKPLRRKFYCEQEKYLEGLALNIQESTIQAMVGIDDRLTELEESELNEKQTRALEIVRYDFNKVIDELDAILFNLTPFQFELERGLIDSFILLGQKLNFLSRGKIRVNFQTKIDNLKLDKDIKINVYRIIERILDLIKYYKKKEPKIESLNNLTNILINLQFYGDELIFKILYDGSPIDTEIGDYRLKEIFQRCNSINASMELGKNLRNPDENLLNRIEIKLYTKIYSSVS